MSEAPGVLDALRRALREGLLSLEGAGDDAVALLRPGSIRPALELLKREGFNVLVDLTAADYLGHKARPGLPGRFQLTYRLMRLDPEQGLLRGRAALQCWVEEGEGPPSVLDLWPCADWLEREVWDMFGIPFTGRPGMRRLLLYEEFQGHPLRKDYPINKRQPLVGPQEAPARGRMLEGDLRPKVA